MIYNYMLSLFSSTRYARRISFFSFWCRNSYISKKTYIGILTKFDRCSIGDYSRVRPLCALHDVEMGKFCSVSRNVRIGLGAHPTYLLSTNSIFYSHKGNAVRSDWVGSIDFQEHKSTKIGNDVWIGEYVTIPGGVTIGDGAVIATGSIVTRDVPDYAVVAGVPAKIIKYRFNKSTIDTLLKIKWWNWSEEQISENLTLFRSDCENIDFSGLENEK